jgi:hypothetical protein
MPAVIRSLPVFGFVGGERMPGRGGLRRRVASPVFEEIDIAGALNRHEQPIVSPLRNRREGLGGRIVRGRRRDFLVVRIGESREHRRLN